MKAEWLMTEVDNGFYNGTGNTGVVTTIGQASLPLPARSVAQLVSELKEKSGLTAEQLGRLMGVSRRSIHNWSAGASISASREERVRQLGLLVF
jgi:DNA-binding transcriptional regulator YiaG